MLSLNKNQENKYSMYVKVDVVLTEEEAIVTSVPALLRGRTSLKTFMSSIETERGVKGTATDGKSAAKQTAEDALIATMVEIAGPVYAYAVEKQNSEMKAITDIRPYMLRELRDTELFTKAEGLYKAVSEVVGELGDFGVTDAVLDGLQDRKGAYQGAMGASGGSSATRVGSTSALERLFTETDTLLRDTLDRLVEGLKSSQRTFYYRYFAARVIQDLGIRHEDEEPTSPPEPPPAP